MPIFAYLAAVGSVLIALMFVTNATLERAGPALVGSSCSSAVQAAPNGSAPLVKPG